MILSTARDYLRLTLWGWPGVLLALVVGAYLAERALLKTAVFSGRKTLLVAAVILAAGLLFTWREQLPVPANYAGLSEELEEQERRAGDRERAMREKQALQRQADRLREDLAAQRAR